MTGQLSDKENQMISNKFKRERQRLLKQFVLYENEIQAETEVYSKQSKLLQELNELNGLFDSILGEIEERQDFLETLDGLESKELESKTKQEMTDRLGELKKVTQMIAEVKKEMKALGN